MFDRSARLYDAIYHWKDYAAEAAKLRAVIAEHKRSSGNKLLDVACGTGGHIPYLREEFQVEGLDLDESILAVASERHPDVPFHHADMVDFDLGRTFDVVACLFSAVAYASSLSSLRAAVGNMARHVAPGGVLIVEPFITVDRYTPGVLHSMSVDEPGLKISRMNLSQVVEGPENPVTRLCFHYQVGTPRGIEQFVENHELGLFTDAQYHNAFQSTGFSVRHDTTGLMGRGLYVASA